MCWLPLWPDAIAMWKESWAGKGAYFLAILGKWIQLSAIVAA